MTEIGMALSNPLNPNGRIPGCVGLPMPSVEVALASIDEAVEESKEMIIEPPFGEDSDLLSGELLVGGPSVFSQYWNKPESTRDSFTADGRWFRTGDTAVVENGVFRIFGELTSRTGLSCGLEMFRLISLVALLRFVFIVKTGILGNKHVPETAYRLFFSSQVGRLST